VVSQGILVEPHLIFVRHLPKAAQTDKLGRPVNIHVFGGMDIKKLYESVTPEEHWRSFLVNAEAVSGVASWLVNLRAGIGLDSSRLA